MASSPGSVISSSLRVPGTVDVDGGEYALLGDAPIQMDLAVAGTLEFLVDHVVHLRAGIDQRGGEYREAAALLDVARRAEEALGRCSALASTPPVSTLPEDGTTVL